MQTGLLQKLIEEDYGLVGRGKWLHSKAHDSLVYNSENETFFWNSTGQRGNIYDYLTHVRGMKKEEARFFLSSYIGGFSENKETREAELPYEKLVELLWLNGKNKKEYWYKRCIKDDTIDRYKLGHYDGWSVIPIYSNHQFVNFQVRRDEPEKQMFYRYKTSQVYLFNELILPFTKTIYITEGLVDCILLNQEGFPAVAAGGVNTWRIDWFSKFSHMENIVYLEDNDFAGKIGSRAIANCLGLGRVKIVTFPHRKEKFDTGDWFKEGGTKETLKEYIANNSKFLFELEGVVNVSSSNRKHTGNKGFIKDQTFRGYR